MASEPADARVRVRLDGGDPLAPVLNPLLAPFRAAAGTVAYLGRLAILACSAARATVRPPAGSPPFFREVSGQLDRLLSLGLPLVGLVHVGMGSFLSMQAYFGATFVDGIGPVTGVGLIRNLAPLLTGFILAGVASARYVAELGHDACHADAEGAGCARRVAARLAASMLAGPILSIWASLVGVAVGWLVANQMMGITPPAFYDMFLEMLWVRDVVGLVAKGAMFGFVTALLACQEGADRQIEADPSAELESVGWSATRAVCLAGLAILVINGAWFLLVYHAGPPFGPTVLTPPAG